MCTDKRRDARKRTMHHHLLIPTVRLSSLFPPHSMFLSATLRLLPVASRQALEREETELYQTKDDILQQSQRLTASFLEQKEELEGSARRSEERAGAADGQLSALRGELDTARHVYTRTLCGCVKSLLPYRAQRDSSPPTVDRYCRFTVVRRSKLASKPKTHV